MQCQNCNEHTATIHLTEMADGQRFEMHLCELCAQKEGLTIKSQVPLNELLSSLLASQQSDESQSSNTSIDSPKCDVCGMTVNTFKKTSLLGCPNDYDSLQSQLEPIITQTQNGNTTHCGKVPSQAPTETKKQVDMINLRHQLEQAVKDEDYETAAKLRDQIEHSK